MVETRDSDKGGGYVAELRLRLSNAFNWARFFLTTTHSAMYLAAKRVDFAGFTRGALLITAAFVLSTICWDFAIDPVNASRVIWLRCLESALMLLWALASWRDVHAPMARLMAVLGPLGVEGTFVHILGVLDQGPSYGMGGFLYFYIFVPFLTLAQPLVFSVMVLMLIAILPPVLGCFGLSPAIHWSIYAAYIGLMIGPVMLILMLFEYLYWRMFSYRQQVEIQATTDGLTAEANRRHFMAEAATRLRRQKELGKPASLLFVDIDRFKTVNDRYGHAVGDKVLIHVAERLRHVLRDHDLIARYGGEEFVVLLQDADTEPATEVAERMRLAVKSDLCRADAHGEDIISTVSIGIATHRAPDPTKLDQLIATADHAAYDAKRAGRDCVVAAQR